MSVVAVDAFNTYTCALAGATVAPAGIDGVENEAATLARVSPSTGSPFAKDNALVTLSLNDAALVPSLVVPPTTVTLVSAKTVDTVEAATGATANKAAAAALAILKFFFMWSFLLVYIQNSNRL